MFGKLFASKNMVLFMLLLLFGFAAGPALAKENPDAEKDSFGTYSQKDGGLQLYQSSDKNSRLALGGEILARDDYWRWFKAPADNNSYNYAFQRTRLNLSFKSEYIDVFIQPQYVQMLGLPDDAVSPMPQGPLGMGGLYYLHNQVENPYGLGFHQGYLQVKDIYVQGVAIKLGRFEYADGLEVCEAADGPQFNALKNMRLADRMISSFDWSAFARSFDGGLFKVDNDKANLTTSFFFPTQGGWEKNMNETIEEIRIAAATLTGKRDTLIPGMEIAGFYYYYDDVRNITQRVDNSGKTTAPDGVDINIHMLGGHALGIYDSGPGKIDALLWGGGQFGDWYELNQRAFAIDGELGYQFSVVPWKPWLRMGYYTGSGDHDPNDNVHGTFFQMAPGTRKYELLPFCDLMNIRDLFFQAIIKPLRQLTLRTEYHLINLTDANDRWYMGSGPTQKKGSIFGYIARPTNNENDLAQELDLMLIYNMNPHLNFTFSYSHVFGGDVVAAIYSESHQADYASLEMQLLF